MGSEKSWADADSEQWPKPDPGEIDLGPLPDRLKRPEHRGKPITQPELAGNPRTILEDRGNRPKPPTAGGPSLAEQAAHAEALANETRNNLRNDEENAAQDMINQSVLTRATSKPPEPTTTDQDRVNGRTLGDALLDIYPDGVTLKTELDFEEFAFYVDYVRKVRALRTRRQS